MKKSLSILSIIAISALWLYFANQFEKNVSQNLIDISSKTNGYVSTNVDDLKINKYFFSAKLGETKILANSPINYSYEALELCYNPFTKQIRLTDLGKKMMVTIGKVSIYTENAQGIIEFDQKTLEDPVKYLDIKYKISQPYVIRFADDNAEIMKAEGSEIHLSGGRYGDNYKIDYSEKVSGFSGMNGVYNIVTKFLGQAEDDYTGLALKEYYSKISQLSEPQDIDFSMMLNADSGLYKNIISLAHKRADLSKIIDQLPILLSDIKDINVDLKVNGPLNDMSGKINARNDSKEFIVDINEKNISKYGKQEIDELIIATADFYTKIFNKEVNDNLFAADDFKKLLAEIFAIKTADFNLNARLDKLSLDFAGDLMAKLDDNYLSIKTDGNANQVKVSNVVKIYDVQPIINKIVTMAEASNTIVSKLDKSDDKVNVTKLESAIGILRSKGYNAMTALHKDKELIQGDALVVDIYAALSEGGIEITVNEKTIDQLMQDERITALWGK